MTTFRDQDLSGAEFTDVRLDGARFVECDLSRVVMRGVDLQDAELDAPWLMEEGGSLVVNGVDVAPLVDAELDRLFPGRGLRRAEDPEGLRAAWAAVERSWAPVVERAVAMPDGTLDRSVGGEWSFAETLRHLVLAIDLWLTLGVHGREDAFHPLGLPHAFDDPRGYAFDRSMFATEQPTWDQLLAARSDRVGLVRDFLATVTPADLDHEARNPHAPGHPETVRSCLHVILGEEWEHLRFALRDLDVIEAEPRQAG